MLMVQTIFLRLILVSDYIYSKHFKQLQLQFTITFRLQARLKNSGKKEIEILNIAFSTPNLHLVANNRKKKKKKESQISNLNFSLLITKTQINLVDSVEFTISFSKMKIFYHFSPNTKI